jgi:hypothetical protein
MRLITDTNHRVHTEPSNKHVSPMSLLEPVNWSANQHADRVSEHVWTIIQNRQSTPIDCATTAQQERAIKTLCNNFSDRRFLFYFFSLTKWLSFRSGKWNGRISRYMERIRRRCTANEMRPKPKKKIVQIKCLHEKQLIFKGQTVMTTRLKIWKINTYPKIVIATRISYRQRSTFNENLTWNSRIRIQRN